MSWNYRVIRRHYPEHDVTTFTIHEVYYDEKGEPDRITSTADGPFGETPEELRSDFDKMRVAFDKPILEYDSFPEGTDR